MDPNVKQLNHAYPMSKVINAPDRTSASVFLVDEYATMVPQINVRPHTVSPNTIQKHCSVFHEKCHELHAWTPERDGVGCQALAVTLSLATVNWLWILQS